jgi:hypothetical protein
VPGMPWLESENPKIDWKERTVTIRKVSREKPSNDMPKATRDLISARRGGYETPGPVRPGRESLVPDIRPHLERVQVG